MQHMRFVLTHKQVKELQHFLHGTKNKLEHTRALAVLIRYEGMTVKKDSTYTACLHRCSIQMEQKVQKEWYGWIED